MRPCTPSELPSSRRRSKSFTSLILAIATVRLLLLHFELVPNGLLLLTASPPPSSRVAEPCVRCSFRRSILTLANFLRIFFACLQIPDVPARRRARAWPYVQSACLHLGRLPKADHLPSSSSHRVSLRPEGTRSWAVEQPSRADLLPSLAPFSLSYSPLYPHSLALACSKRTISLRSGIR